MHQISDILSVSAVINYWVISKLHQTIFIKTTWPTLCSGKKNLLTRCLTSITWISRMYALIWWCFSPNWYSGRTDTAEDTEDDLTSSLSFLTIYHVLWKTSLCMFWLFSHISCLRKTPLGISPGFLNVQPVPFWAPMMLCKLCRDYH